MKTFTLAAAAAVLSTSYAATVTLETTKCPGVDIKTEQFDIELNTNRAVAKHLSHVCGLRILHSSSGVDVNSIQCQAFKDTAGTQPGSAIFTIDSPAQIATNPVQEESIFCSTNNASNASLARRQDNNSTTASDSTSASASTPASDSPSVSAAVSTVLSTETASVSSDATGSSAPSTSVETISATASGKPSSSGNSTKSTGTNSPSATSSDGATETDSAAGRVDVGFGVVLAAFAAVLL